MRSAIAPTAQQRSNLAAFVFAIAPCCPVPSADVWHMQRGHAEFNQQSEPRNLAGSGYDALTFEHMQKEEQEQQHGDDDEQHSHCQLQQEQPN